MAQPPKMLLLSAAGHEALVTLPTNYEKAIQAAIDKFNIPKDGHIVRLSCKASELPMIGAYAGGEDVFIDDYKKANKIYTPRADNDSYYYAIAGKFVARLDVHVFDKNPSKPPSGGEGRGPAAEGGGSGGARGGGKVESAGGGRKGESGKVNSSGGGVGDIELHCENVAGKLISMGGTIFGDLSKGPPDGGRSSSRSKLTSRVYSQFIDYLGTLTIEPATFRQRFVGKQLGPNEVLTKFVVHDKNTARLLFRARSIRPKVDILFPEERNLEVTLSVADWTVTTAYPMTSLIPDAGRQKLRWFLRIKPGGIVEDLLTGTESSGLFYELLPITKARPTAVVRPDDPLIPAWPDIRPLNAWCLPQTIFVPHIDRILRALGLPAECRTSMITSWLPGITRHKHIAYRILNKDQLSPTSALTIIPPPQALIRIFVLFRGVTDEEVKDWEDRSVVQAEMGLDWKEAVGFTSEMADDSLFRVIEYGAMECYDG